MSTFLYTLFLISVGYFVRRLQEDANKLSSFQRGYDAGREDTQREIEDSDTPRDKAEVSLGMKREDAGFGGDWK